MNKPQKRKRTEIFIPNDVWVSICQFLDAYEWYYSLLTLSKHHNKLFMSEGVIQNISWILNAQNEHFIDALDNSSHNLEFIWKNMRRLCIHGCITHYEYGYPTTRKWEEWITKILETTFKNIEYLTLKSTNVKIPYMYALKCLTISTTSLQFIDDSSTTNLENIYMDDYKFNYSDFDHELSTHILKLIKTLKKFKIEHYDSHSTSIKLTFGNILNWCKFSNFLFDILTNTETSILLDSRFIILANQEPWKDIKKLKLHLDNHKVRQKLIQNMSDLKNVKLGNNVTILHENILIEMMNNNNLLIESIVSENEKFKSYFK
jgi:hypothetical protein